MIDEKTGKECPFTWMRSGSRTLSWCAIQGPAIAPMKPTMMDTISPPRVPPAMPLPMAPQPAAITTRMRRPGSVVGIRSTLLVDLDGFLLAAARDREHDPDAGHDGDADRHPAQTHALD